MFGPQPGRHKGRVRRIREGLPQPAAHRQQEALRPAVGPSLGRRDPAGLSRADFGALLPDWTVWEIYVKNVFFLINIWLEFYL